MIRSNNYSLLDSTSETLALAGEIQDNYYDEFGLPFKEKFPSEHEKLMDELNKLK